MKPICNTKFCDHPAEYGRLCRECYERKAARSAHGSVQCRSPYAPGRSRDSAEEILDTKFGGDSPCEQNAVRSLEDQ